MPAKGRPGRQMCPKAGPLDDRAGPFSFARGRHGRSRNGAISSATPSRWGRNVGSFNSRFLCPQSQGRGEPRFGGRVVINKPLASNRSSVVFVFFPVAVVTAVEMVEPPFHGFHQHQQPSLFVSRVNHRACPNHSYFHTLF